MDVYLHALGTKIPALSAKKSSVLDLTAKPSTTADANESANTSLRMNELKKMLTVAPSVDEQRVARVTSAIQGGHYEINPQKAAEKIIELELLLP